MVFATKYQVGGNPECLYASYVRAKSLSDAVNICQIRGLNEEIDFRIGNKSHDKLDKTPLELFKSYRFLDCLHSLAFYSSIYLRMNPEHIDEILGDQGVLHEMIHFMKHGETGGVEEVTFEQMERQISDFQDHIPGL